MNPATTILDRILYTNDKKTHLDNKKSNQSQLGISRNFSGEQEKGINIGLNSEVRRGHKRENGEMYNGTGANSIGLGWYKIMTC